MKTPAESSYLLETIMTRRSIRQYAQRPVPRVAIERLLTAAIWAPSAHNRQPWRFVVVESAGQKERLARGMGARLRADLMADSVPQDIIDKDVARSYERLTFAPVLVCVCLSMRDMDVYPDEKRAHNEVIMAVQSVAMAGQNLLLAAHDAGLGACWMCAPLFCPDVVRDVLSLPNDWQPQGIITLGYPAQDRKKDRHLLEDHVLWR